MITLVAVLCLGPLCVDEIVPTQMMVVGEINSPIAMPFSWGMCQSTGIRIAADWMANEQQYRGWRLSEIKCVPGNYIPSKRA